MKKKASLALAFAAIGIAATLVALSLRAPDPVAKAGRPALADEKDVDDDDEALEDEATARPDGDGMADGLEKTPLDNGTDDSQETETGKSRAWRHLPKTLPRNISATTARGRARR